MPPEKIETVSFALRITPSLKKTLEQLAKEDGRSLNSYIMRALLEHAARHPMHTPLKPKKKG